MGKNKFLGYPYTKFYKHYSLFNQILIHCLKFYTKKKKILPLHYYTIVSPFIYIFL